jgi:hypothetical protein
MSLGNRAKAQETILHWIQKITPGDHSNVQIYQNLFKMLSDEQFDDLMVRLKNDQACLALVVPNMSETKIDVGNNLRIGEQLGHRFFQRVWMQSPHGGDPYLSPIEYLVVMLPLRRQAQILIKKISIPEDNKSVDYLTGQPTGASKGAKISYPELQILESLGLPEMAVELIKYRGGDTQGFNLMNKSISRTGGVSMTALDAFGTKVKSTQTLSTFLTGMHLANTLTED